MNFTYSQVVTTVDDFNHITTGFAEDKKIGRDIKPGYSLEEVSTKETFTDDFGRNKDVQLFYFKKGTENKSILLVAADPGKQAYFKCINTGASDRKMWEHAFKNINGLTPEWNKAITWGLLKTIGSKLL